MPLAAVASVLINAAIAQITVSRHPSPVDRIICHGSYSHPTIEAYGGLADFCHDAGVSCDRWLQTGPKSLTFDGLMADYAVHRDWTDMNPDGEEWTEFFMKQRQAEICYNRCTCLNTPPTNGHRGRPTARQRRRPNVFEWDFNTARSIQRPRIAAEEPFDFWGWTGRVEDQDDVTIRSYGFVGNPAQKPTCQGSLSSFTIDALRQQDDYETMWPDPTKLCLHRYYGGNPLGSMGAVCKQVKANSVSLEFPMIYRSSMFVEIIAPSVSKLGNNHNAAIKDIKTFCRRVCTCLPFEEYKAQLPVAQRSPGKLGKTLSHEQRLAAYAAINAANEHTRGKIIGGHAMVHRPDTCPQGSCQGPSDCGDGCACTVLSDSIDYTSKVMQTGLMAVCMGLGILREGVSSRVAGRSIGEAESGTVCACNATYLSATCCGSRDGMVWEGSEGKFGELFLSKG